MSLPDCPFCRVDPERVLGENDLVMTIHDAFPVSRGHTLIIPRRHVASFFDTTPREKAAILQALQEAKEHLQNALHPDGYNIGINDGAAAGQTVRHLHVHLIPRYEGDAKDPRGGVRWIFPEKARYWKE